MYEFEHCPERRGTDSIKWGKAPEDVLPMWVADMDFPVAPEVLEAIQNRVSHPIFGYSDENHTELREILAKHYKKLYDVRLEPDWIVWIPSVMPGLTIALKMQGGAFLYNIPMYNHIRMLTDETKQPVAEVPMYRGEDGQYRIDFPAMEKAVTDDVRTFILCNPHNPVGRMYTREELEQIAAFCEKHGLLLASDEIHCEFALDRKHIPAFSLNEWTLQNSITVSSAGKIGNVPGLPMGFAIIPNQKLREAFCSECDGMFASPNVVAAAAYRVLYDGSCDKWKEELRERLRKNRAIVEAWVEGIPQITIPHNEATYLSFLDCSELKLENPSEFFLKEAKVMLSDGEIYGYPQGARLNFGCPASQLVEALSRMKEAIISHINR